GGGAPGRTHRPGRGATETVARRPDLRRAGQAPVLLGPDAGRGRRGARPGAADRRPVLGVRPLVAVRRTPPGRPGIRRHGWRTGPAEGPWRDGVRLPGVVRGPTTRRTCARSFAPPSIETTPGTGPPTSTRRAGAAPRSAPGSRTCCGRMPTPATSSANPPRGR